MLNIDKLAKRLFKKLPPNIQKELVNEVQIFTTQPLAGKPLKGKYRLLRALHLTIEGTAYSIIYQIFEQSEMVVIRLVGTRENIYRKLEHMKVKP